MKLFFMCFLFFLGACSTLPPTPTGFQYKTAQTNHFSLAVWEKDGIQKNKILRFYIEGNGNPTPRTPTALNLAQKDSFPNIIVLSRPCQYEIDNKLCKNQDIWSIEQYSPELLKEIQEVIIFYIQKYKASAIEFVAYDGGAPIAFNIAPEIGRVRQIITIGGILDTEAFARQNNLPPFNSGRNPAQNTTLISQIPQIHYVGEKDNITTTAMAERFVSKLSNPRFAVVKLVPNIGHFEWDEVQLDY